MFTSSQQQALAAPLDRANVQTRNQSNRNLSYLEGWHVIAEANRIFGFDGWQRETLHCQCVAERERSIGSGGDPRGQRSGWGVTYTAKARIKVGEIIREGSGAGHGIDMDLGQAHESAIKEAETDAMKRALMTFGNQFGLALYDKQQREVISSSALAPVHQVAQSKLTTAAVEPPAEVGLELIDPATIKQILSTVRGLPRPALEGFSKAFRKHFEVPADATSIADLICQRQHHDWIKMFMAQHQQLAA